MSAARECRPDDAVAIDIDAARRMAGLRRINPPVLYRRRSGSGPVLPRLRQCFDELDVNFNKGSAAKLIRRDLIRCKAVGELPDGVKKKAETLLTALRDAFGTSDEETK